MGHVAKIACSIDPKLLERVEAVRAKTGESRSALISRALLALTRESARAHAISRYVEAYRQEPEGPSDVRAARAIARRSLARLDWDDE